MKSKKQLQKITLHSIMTAAGENLPCKFIGDEISIEKVSPDYTVIPRPGNICPKPEGGYKIVCEICETVCRTKPDDAKSFCEYVARANGWRARSKKWRCPEHLKTVKEQA